MKTIFHIITTLERGGAENQLLVLVNEQLSSGFDVRVAYLKGIPELKSELENSGAKVYSDLSGLSPFIQPLAFRRIMLGREPIVHAHLPRAELVAALTPAKFKLFSTRHNSEQFFPNAPRTISNFLARIVEIRATRIIAISEAVRSFLLRQGEVINHKKIEVVLYGYHSRVNREQVSHKPTTNGLSVGTISRLSLQKDIPTMLRAFADFREKSGLGQLSIVGGGSLEGELKELARTLSIDHAVRFLGKTSKVMEYLQSLDVFILTSSYEGFGLVLLEAMDARIPILASRNSAIPEVLGADFPGLCEPGNYLEFSQKLTLLQHSANRKRFLTLQESRLRKFRADTMCRAITELYQPELKSRY